MIGAKSIKSVFSERLTVQQRRGRTRQSCRCPTFPASTQASSLFCFSVLFMAPNTDKSANQTVEQSYNRIPNESFSALFSPVTYAGDQAGSRESRSSRGAESEQNHPKKQKKEKEINNCKDREKKNKRRDSAMAGMERVCLLVGWQIARGYRVDCYISTGS